MFVDSKNEKENTNGDTNRDTNVDSGHTSSIGDTNGHNKERGTI